MLLIKVDRLTTKKGVIMKNKIMIIVVALALVGCGSDDKEATTINESGIVAPPGEELKAQGYDDQYVKVANTERPDYAQYRKEWKRVNSHPTEGYKLVDKEPVEINLDELAFKRAFGVQYCAKGEGHTFWWRGSEYTTDLLIEDPEQPSASEE